MRVQSLGWEDPLEEKLAAHSSILAWRAVVQWVPRESETTEHAHLEAPSPQTDISGVAARTREFGEGKTQLSPEQTSSSSGVSPFLSS